ncbi:nuclear pore complex protein Nup133 [Cylas formicarius]|uniref:nuclear pore complex protein Nup133 n=1 Tax=Cylas formicarius TaxID=197179 RepID=UPI002958854E|nr:nuclear pore complex protein Nup133 [Cylas formicarius]
MNDSFRSLLPPRSGSSLGSLSSVKKQSLLNPKGSVRIILKSAHNFVQRFGLPVPVRVEEAFAFSERNSVITARLEGSYAWVVCSRKLYIWQFSHNVNRSNPSSKQKLFPRCYELQLPQSDLAHRAELVTIFENKDSFCCIAVSPEGMIRYWPDISQEHVSVDQHVELQGQECDSLINVQGLGCIIVTTTCTVVLAKVKPGNYGPDIVCDTLRTQLSWLGGVSRRVSSIFFGPMATYQGTETRIIRLLAIPNAPKLCTVYVLAGSTLQKWILSEHNEENLVLSSDIGPIVRDGYRSQISHWDSCDPADIDVWILDIQEDADSILLLTASVNLHFSPQVYYVLISVPITSTSIQIRNFILLELSNLYNEENPTEILSYKFILCGNTVYLYNSKSISVIKMQEPADTLEFHHSQDQIYGATVCDDIPVFLSKQHGLITVSKIENNMNLSFATSASNLDSSSSCETCLTSPSNLSVYQMNADEICSAHKDTASQLKAAFIFHVKSQLTECLEIVNSLFASDMATLAGIDAPLDLVVLQMSKEMLDDTPAADPRWNNRDESCPAQGLGSSHSMQVLHQIRDKQKAYNLFMKFLREAGLWDRFGAVIIRDMPVTTVHALAEYSEKIMAAEVLKLKSASELLEKALQRVVKNFAGRSNKLLTTQDIFFREISRVNEVILCLSKVCKDICHSAMSPADVAEIIHEANEIITSVFQEILQYRQQNAELFIVNQLASDMQLQYLPWTAAEGPEGLMDALMLQYSLTVNYGVKVARKQLKNKLLKDLVTITDLILDGKNSHLESLNDRNAQAVLRKQFTNCRTKLIKPFVEEQAWEQAAMLAEKYLDYEMLVAICELTNNEERLEEYKRRFVDSDFMEHMLNWYLKEGKHEKILNKNPTHGDAAVEYELRRFLDEHPSLLWVQQIYDKDFSAAAETLQCLSQRVSQSLKRKKTVLSLCKLAKLAAPEDDNDFISEIDDQLELVSLQEYIPDYVLQKYGYDPMNPIVIAPREMIALYTCIEYSDSNELDYKRALSIIKFLETEEEKSEASLKIWRAALLRDFWNTPTLDSPLQYIQNTIFFKLANLCANLGDNPHNVLPPIEVLVDDPALAQLNSNKNFQFLLKAGYDYFYRTHL